MMLRWTLILTLAIALTGCGWFQREGGYYQDDGPPRGARVDVSKIPDAVPRKNP